VEPMGEGEEVHEQRERPEQGEERRRHEVTIMSRRGLHRLKSWW
jgi:hypothetical protein